MSKFIIVDHVVSFLEKDITFSFAAIPTEINRAEEEELACCSVWV
jgi:hypothetical protein